MINNSSKGFVYYILNFLFTLSIIVLSFSIYKYLTVSDYFKLFYIKFLIVFFIFSLIVFSLKNFTIKLLLPIFVFLFFTLY